MSKWYEPEIVDGNFWMLTDNFVLVIDICRGKVDQDVDYEHDVNWKCKISVSIHY